MSGDVVGPPPGLVPSDAGSVEPPDAPPPPSFGGGGRTMSAQSHPVGGLSDDSSHVWAPDADDGAAEQRQTGEESTRYEWNAGDGADRSRGNGRPHQDDRTFEDVAAAYSRRVSWETTTAGSTREGRHRYWQEEDPWVMYGDPWQREDYYTRPSRGRTWVDNRETGYRGQDAGSSRGVPWMDGRDGAHGGSDSAGHRGYPWADGRDSGYHGQDSGGYQGGLWADGRDGHHGVHDHGGPPRWNESSGHGSDPGSWQDNRSYDSYGDHKWAPTWGGQEEGVRGPRPTERLTVPTFSAEDTDDLGNSARSYLRQIEVWKRITRLPTSQLGLVLYQHLQGKAWIAAEELSVSRLSTPEGLGYFTSWISARFLDLEVARIGKAFSDFFRKLRRKPSQTVREYNTEYDRLHGRLREVGCVLPEECAAWLYLDRLQLEEAQELNLLASVGNRYSLHHLQHAAVLHDRGQRKPWESGNPKGRRPNFAHLTNHETDEDEDYENNDHEIPQEVAEALMTYQSAKEKYRSQQRARGSTEVDKNAKGEDHSGSDPRGSNGGGDREAKVRAMKARSFCGGCGRRGHWHKDDECPLNKGGGASKGDHGAKNVAMTNVMPADVYTLKHMSDNLVGVADTACARTVAGSQWLQSYTNVLATMGEKPLLQKECEAYKFGTGKVHFSSFYVIVNFKLGGYIIQVRTSIITGDIPLLLSKTVLGKMGMIYDVQGGKADFRAINLMNYELATTASGHPAIPIVPVSLPPGGTPDLQVEDLRLQRTEQYMAVFAVAHQALQPPEYSGIFYDKKLDPSTRNMLSQDRLPLDVFLAWWEKSAIRRDFWVETPTTWVRVHMIPRRSMFNPSTWRTGSTVLRDMLVASIGQTRMTESVCCASGKWVESTVDQWEPGQVEQHVFPLLWTGRTVFFKLQAPGPCPRDPGAADGRAAMQREGGSPQQDDEANALVGSRQGGGHSPSQLERSRAESNYPRAQRDLRGEDSNPADERAQFTQPPGTDREGEGAKRDGPRANDEGSAAEVDQVDRQFPGGHPGDLRTVERVYVPGSPRRVREVGSNRGDEVTELFSRADDVREVVEGRAAGQGGPHQDQGGHERLRGLPERDPQRLCESTTEPQHARVSSEGKIDCNLIEGIVGGSECILKGVPHPNREREREDYLQADQPRDLREDHHGREGGPGRARRDCRSRDEAGDLEGQGEDLGAVMTRGRRALWWSRDAGEVHCCGSVCCTEIITEEEYNYGLKNRALNYEEQHLPNFTGDTFEHNERSDHTRGASTSEVFQQCGAAGQPPGDVGRAPPLRYGDGNYDWEDYTFSNCQRILEDNAYPQGKPSMRAVQHGEGDPEGQIYVTYGLFTHGGVHGLTRASKDNDAILRYLNNLGREHLGDEATWTSISVTRNIGVSVHRDSNNLKDSKNYTVTFGQDAGGDIWMEEDVDENQVHGKGIVWKRDRTGAWVPGRYYNDKEHFIDFNPFRRHASEEWTGDRWCLTYHTVRGVAKIGGELKKYLGRAGFPVPKVNIDGKYKESKSKAKKSTRNGIMNAAGKISVLMATFLTAASSYMSEIQGTVGNNDPVVIMEIGGWEGTTEAVDLSKTVIEPMMWKDFLNPEVQKTAYHFVREAAPRELRVHVDEMPRRAEDVIQDLAREQLHAGGVVVLRGKKGPTVAQDFPDYIEYKFVDNEDGWMVLSKRTGEAKTMTGIERPHQVCAVEGDPQAAKKDVKYDGSGITFETGVPKIVQASLRRLHQNLGHPRAEDLCRHLRLAGCEPHVIKAVKGMKCETCDATRHAQVARPTTLPRMLDFNSCVGIDIFYCHDCDDTRHAFLTMVDWATTY